MAPHRRFRTRTTKDGIVETGAIRGLLVMSNLWDIPPFPDAGDAEPEIIYTAMGHALTTWELVEEELSSLFALFVGRARRHPETQAAARAYGAVIAFNSRAEMLSAAATAFFGSPYLTPAAKELEVHFRELLKQVNGWVGRRNDVAHGRIRDVKGKSGCFLVPSLYNSRKNRFGEDEPAYVLSSKEIKKFQQAFELIGMLVRDFWYRLLDAQYPSLRTQLQQEQRHVASLSQNPEKRE